MADFENTVENQELQSVQDDAVQAEAPQQDASLSLAEAMDTLAEGDMPQDAGEGQAIGGEKPLSGGIKGRLMESERKGHDKGYAEGQAAAQAAWAEEKARYDQRLQRLAELELEQDAAKLAQEEGCTVTLARRILRAERGMAPEAQQDTAAAQAQPRDAQTGRFVSRESAPDVNDRAKTLYAQAKDIQRMGGVDVMALFNSDAAIRDRVARGEMDFFDVAREYGQKPQTRAMPPVTRSGQPGNVRGRSIRDLSDNEFDRLDALLDGGAVIDMSR